MNFAMQLTLDGMVRALRLKLHAIGEAHEQAERLATLRNEEALTLLNKESRRFALEAGDEFGR